MKAGSPESPAIVVGDRRWSHGELFALAQTFGERLAGMPIDLRTQTEPKLAVLCEPGPEFVAAMWASWQARATAVPLCERHPPTEWRFVLQDTDAVAVWTSARYREALRAVAKPLGIAVIDTTTTGAGPGSDPGRAAGAVVPVEFEEHRAATVVYTSGTTGRPKGAVIVHAALRNRLDVLWTAWEFRPEDRVLNLLPLHHVHGLENALLCPLRGGASVEVLGGFEASRAWDRLASGEISVFMGVPIHYARLVAEFDASPVELQQRRRRGLGGLRLAISGSAALPTELLERWERITGSTLLERYGMTELGMAISNPYRGRRIAGTVGQALGGVELRRVSEDAGDETDPQRMAELWVRSPSMFREYLGRPEETAAAFRDGWFRTGDMAVEHQGAIRLMGRANRDVLNVGGNLVSALEVEDCFLRHPAIAEAAVIGVEDPAWGQRVALVAVAASGEASPDLDALRLWAESRLAREKLPTRLAVVDELPRNLMGKVRKEELVELFC